MFEVLTYGTIAVVALGIMYAYDGSRDAFHPLVLIGPVLIFLYGWMPLKIASSGQLTDFFTPEQLTFIQGAIFMGVTAFVLGCLSVGSRVRKKSAEFLPVVTAKTLENCAIVMAVIGLVGWAEAVVHAGGFLAAFSKPYGGGWDESGYIKDAPMLLFSAILLIFAASRGGRLQGYQKAMIAFFASPWILQALLASRRGPTFLVAVMVGIGWYMHRAKRPSLVTLAVSGIALGYLILFLVVNRNSIYLGSDFELTSDVGSYVDTAHTGNEYVYGGGAMVTYRARHNYFWGRRYIAQILVRPIPSSIWPTKYEDAGLAELKHNAGTGEGFADVLGWEGAPGSAPGLIGDLWIEFSWLSVPVLFGIGRLYGYVWRKAVEVGHVWRAQYVILASLSLYLVMQTMEAVIFRLMILSIPVWFTWRLAQRRTADEFSLAIPLDRLGALGELTSR